MCYFLRLASPLTLSEVRSMLPAGLTAGGGATAELAWLRGLLPAAQTAVHLRVGSCACDAIVTRRMASSIASRTAGSRAFTALPISSAWMRI